MYTAGLGLSVLASFAEHDGFDGVILGHPGPSSYHLELTSRRAEQADPAPSAEDLLVFYIPRDDEWTIACGRMLDAGFREVSSSNPYWDRAGRTFEDIDGYRVVLQHAEWSVDATDGGVPGEVTAIEDQAACEALDAFLVDRLYEFNANATGYVDGRLLAGCVRSDTGEVIAGYTGHTWGGCCTLANVWVHEEHRGKGLGALLLQSAEAEARARGCVQVVLATHSFQAPGFYERQGYERTCVIEGQPMDHADIIYVKSLRGDERSGGPGEANHA